MESNCGNINEKGEWKSRRICQFHSLVFPVENEIYIQGHSKTHVAKLIQSSVGIVVNIDI